jgi:hypothetical protein
VGECVLKCLSASIGRDTPLPVSPGNGTQDDPSLRHIIESISSLTNSIYWWWWWWWWWYKRVCSFLYRQARAGANRSLAPKLDLSSLVAPDRLNTQSIQ